MKGQMNSFLNCANNGVITIKVFAIKWFTNNHPEFSAWLKHHRIARMVFVRANDGDRYDRPVVFAEQKQATPLKLLGLTVLRARTLGENQYGGWITVGYALLDLSERRFAASAFDKDAPFRQVGPERWNVGQLLFGDESQVCGKVGE